jgi:hypothetical protein
MFFVDSTLNPSQQATAIAALLTATFVAGIFVLIALTVAAMVAVVWRVSLCFEVIVEQSMHSAALYIQSDPAVKLLMLALITYAVVQLLRLERRVMP